MISIYTKLCFLSVTSIPNCSLAFNCFQVLNKYMNCMTCKRYIYQFGLALHNVHFNN